MKLRIPAQNKVLSLLICLFCLLLMAKGVSAQDEISDLLGRINDLRAAKGLPAYTLNGALAAAAQSQSQWLIDNSCEIAHVHPDGSSPRSRAQAAGYTTSEVSENIYCGGFATVGDAWIFWINSGIHYAGLVNTRYKEIGIGVAHSANGSGFTLVFGNPGGPDFVPPAPAGGDDSVSAAASGPVQPPSYVVGVDEHGNIKHEIQPGDTIGDILLIYGYTWADIPTLLALNNMTQDDFRTLEVGTVLLIPPQAGTYTPTPGEAAPLATTEAPTTEPPAQIAVAVLPSATPAPTNTLLAPEPTTAEVVQSANTEGIQPAALIEPSSTPSNIVEPSSNAGVVVPSATALGIALAATDAPVSLPKTAGTVTQSSRTSPALIVALVVQVGVLLGAGFEFIRRMRRRKR